MTAVDAREQARGARQDHAADVVRIELYLRLQVVEAQLAEALASLASCSARASAEEAAWEVKPTSAPARSLGRRSPSSQPDINAALQSLRVGALAAREGGSSPELNAFIAGLASPEQQAAMEAELSRGPDLLLSPVLANQAAGAVGQDSASLPGVLLPPGVTPLPSVTDLPPTGASLYGYNICRNANVPDGGCCQQITTRCCTAHSRLDHNNVWQVCFNAETHMLRVVDNTDSGAVEFQILMAQPQPLFLPPMFHGRWVGPSLCSGTQDFTIYAFNR